MNLLFNSNFSNIGGFSGGLKAKRQKFGVFSFIILIMFGAIFTAAGIFAVKSSKIDPSWPKVSGQVVDIGSRISSNSTTYTPVVQYAVKGQTYKVTSSTGSSSYPHIGDTKEVAYNPTQPNEAKVVSSGAVNGLLYIFPLIGILCLILAPILFIKSLRRGSDINKLVQTGQKLQGIIVNIQTFNSNNNYNGYNNNSFNSNNTTYKIEVSATDSSGTVRNYVSDSLTGIGGLSMADYRSTPIPIYVYVNPSNPSDYYVDVSEIPNLTPERIVDLIKSVTHAQTTNTFTQTEQPNPLPQPPVPPVQTNVNPPGSNSPVPPTPPQPPAV